MRSGEPSPLGVRARSPGTGRRGGGFVALAALLAVALLSLTAAASLSAGAALSRRDAEAQLLAVGLEFQEALRSYANVPRAGQAPAGAHGPRTLEELLRDPRVPGVRRHLRQVYADPMTGRREWGLVRDAQGFIVGIHSLAEGTPVRQAGFEAALAQFEGAMGYGQWVFGLPGSEHAISEANREPRNLRKDRWAPG